MKELKEAPPPHGVTEAQYLIDLQLHSLEERTKLYPFLSSKEVVMLLNDFEVCNPSRQIERFKTHNVAFAFSFGNAEDTKLPAFQFKDKFGVYKSVPKLCKILSGLNDWAVYQWLTTFNEDLGCAPADALGKLELEDDLLYLAGLFKSRSTLADLSFVAE